MPGWNLYRDKSSCAGTREYGTALIFELLPTAVTILPTINWGGPKETACKLAPVIIMKDPTENDFRLPSQFPSHILVVAPTRNPKLYDGKVISGSNQVICMGMTRVGNKTYTLDKWQFY